MKVIIKSSFQALKSLVDCQTLKNVLLVDDQYLNYFYNIIFSQKGLQQMGLKRKQVRYPCAPAMVTFFLK